MPKAKKKSATPVKKPTLKKTSSAKKTIAAKKIKKTSSTKSKTTSVKKKTKKATKKTIQPKKTAAKKVVKKVIAKKAKPAKKAVAKKHAPKKIARKEAPKKVSAKTTTHHAKPTIKEDKMIETTTVDELDFTPYEIDHNEDYMTEEQLEHFRKILLRWKQQLMQEVDSTVIHMQEEGLAYPDPIDRASQEEGFNLELRTRDRERKLIKKIESALDSIESGDYGYCADCGAEIGVRRLEARPTADKCIDCKTYEEIREKQSGGL